MIRPLTLVLVCVAGCEITDQSDQPDQSGVAVKRQAGTGLIYVGSDGGRLGSSVAGCTTFYAGAPGLPAVWTSPGTQLTPGFAPQGLGVVVDCNQTTAFTVGSAGLFSFSGGTFAQVASWPPSERLVVSGLNELFTVGTDSVLRSLSFQTGQQGVQTLQLPMSLSGRAFVEIRDVVASDQVFALGDPAARRVLLIKRSQLDGSWSFTVPIVSLVNGFGRSLAVGDFSPAHLGVELAIGAEGRVIVVEPQNWQTLYELSSGEPSFGSSLATRSGWYDNRGSPLYSLDLLFVGTPGLDQVEGFVGDAGQLIFRPTPVPPNSPIGYGHSIAWSPLVNELVIGAPQYVNNAGAVYAAELTRPSSQGVDVVECETNRPCAMCKRCIGGVVCVPDGCGDAGFNFDGGVDAGTIYDDGGGALFPDAGRPDAGTMNDAGRPDAGVSTTNDAGRPDSGVKPDDDAGVVEPDAGLGPPVPVLMPDQFEARACGCSSTEAIPLALGFIVLSLVRRRRLSR